MSAFAAAVSALFADPNIGRDAVYTPEGDAPVLVRVVARRADAITPKFIRKTAKQLISFRPNGRKCYNMGAVR